MSRRVVNAAIVLSLALCAAGLLLSPQEATDAVRDSMLLCGDVIIPSLFPFFVLTSLLVELGAAESLGRALDKLMRPLFRCNGACGMALALGMISGYPVGARCAISLYEKKLCNKAEAERMLSFCNNSGPAFILGAVGAGILGSGSAGWLLYAAHTLASLSVGLIFRFYKKSDNGLIRVYNSGLKTKRAYSAIFTSCVKDSFQSILNICAFVIFFAVAMRMLFVFGILSAAARALAALPLGISAANAEKLISGLIEITSGLWGLSGSELTSLAKYAMAAFMLGWAGLSVHFQVLSYLADSGLSCRTYIAGKAAHACISALYTYILYRLFLPNRPVSAMLSERIEAIARMDFTTTLATCVNACLLIIALAFISSAYTGWCREKKHR